MIIPPAITEQFGMDADLTQNDYYMHGSLMFDRLTKVYEKEIPYIPDDMAMLAKTLERFYKGAIETVLKKNPAIKIREKNLIDVGHHLSRLADLFELVSQKDLFDYSKPYASKDKAIFLKRLTNMYYSASYETYPKESEFREIYQVVKQQKELIEKYLNPKERGGPGDSGNSINWGDRGDDGYEI